MLILSNLFRSSLFLFFITTTTSAFAPSPSFSRPHLQSLQMSSSSSSPSEAAEEAKSEEESDLAVVGVGVLGADLCQQLLASSEFSGRTITGVTKTKSRHDLIRNIAFRHVEISESPSRLILETLDEVPKDQKFKDVVFCAPPSGFEDYPAAVEDAMTNLWEGPDGGGVFVFTSSGGIYGKGKEGETVNESSPTADPDANPRIGRLVKAEQICLNNGGCVLRLAGLYNLDRGAHNYWLEQWKQNKKEIMGSPDSIINLLHYEDAAASCLYALKAGSGTVSKRTFLISDGNPLTQKGICESALKSKHYADFEMPSFAAVGGEGASDKGKIYDGTWSNEQLQWKPKYVSFDDYMSHH